MSLPAAVPVAVLVLAWDEAAPAVRAVVEATEAPTQALDSVVVLVPAATGEPTQEDFLPLTTEEAAPPVLAAASEVQPKLEADNAASEVLEAPSTTPSVLPDLPAQESTPTVLPPLGTSPEALPAPTVPTVLDAVAPAPLTWSAVRVLRLSSFSLPELTELSKQTLPGVIWQGGAALPVAPYLGSQVEGINGEALPVDDLGSAQPQVVSTALELEIDAFVAPTPTLPAADQPEQPLPALPILAPDYLLTEPPVPALDAEADLAPSLLDEPSPEEALLTQAPLTEPLGPAHAGWSEDLAALRTPLPLEEPKLATDFEDEASYYAATVGEPPATEASDSTTEPRVVSQPFEAPNLNFQVIQYARFAVPVALAQAPFAAIYAPAWPTWLAAQELRYRTRQPLVLHVSTLAAGEADSLETATSWQAELQRQALHRADLILAETPELARRLRLDLGLPSDVVRTVAAADADAVAQALRTAQLRSSDSAS
ncbi:hypothetical protein FNT36_21805 [Hymenobacter setariae]|uniref:Glycosyltransferase subfamily 4-like N-terminal domain-containing protein n=1 Tax=Hymenobacter setariae TaxID=2594794 RepID=A0A558BMR7_9BACT|nr:hypothetical protein FNT36_21805 [Hymenobacter setariae]